VTTPTTTRLAVAASTAALVLGLGAAPARADRIYRAGGSVQVRGSASVRFGGSASVRVGAVLPYSPG
jgi:hypothetical protein